MFNKDNFYKCEFCENVFNESEIRFVEMRVECDNPMYINCEGEVIQDGSKPDIKNGDKMLACPKCMKVHPEGFEMLYV